MTSTQLRPTRRTLVRGAAWSVPVVSIAAAAPAFASSICADGVYEVRWADFNNTTKVGAAVRTSTSGTGAVGNTALTVTVSSVFGGSMVAASTGNYSNLSKSPGNVGGTGAVGLTIMQRVTGNSVPSPRADSFQRVTLKFNRPVWNLKFVVTDIDAATSQYRDRVFASGSPTSVLQAEVTGGGTSGDPWRPTSNNVDQDAVTESGGNVAVSYGTFSSDTYTITYWNDQPNTINSNGLQGVFLANLSFSSETC